MTLPVEKPKFRIHTRITTNHSDYELRNEYGSVVSAVHVENWGEGFRPNEDTVQAALTMLVEAAGGELRP